MRIGSWLKQCYGRPLKSGQSRPDPGVFLLGVKRCLVSFAVCGIHLPTSPAAVLVPEFLLVPHWFLP